MKKSIIYSLLIVLAAFYACDPIETRDDNDQPITAEELQISATPVVVNGKNSNKIVLENHSPVLSAWDYGVGISYKAADTVTLVVVGTTNIKFTGLNPDGSYLTKEIPVTVDELSFYVAPEWGYLCGTGEKTWVWDDTDGQAVWGNGGYKGCAAPCWWTVSKTDIEGQDPTYGSEGYMVFSLSGASLTKSNASGSNHSVGSFSFNMNKTTLDDGGNVWAKGKLTTKNVTVLAGFQPNGGGAPVNEYDILQLDNDKMYLAWPEPGAGSWGTAWFWMFKKK